MCDRGLVMVCTAVSQYASECVCRVPVVATDSVAWSVFGWALLVLVVLFVGAIALGSGDTGYPHLTGYAHTVAARETQRVLDRQYSADLHAPWFGL